MVEAAVAMRDRGGSMSDIIRTAINAWPFGAVCHYTIENTEGWELILPLPQERQNAET